MRPSPSTSATSPSRAAPSSRAMIVRIVSPRGARRRARPRGRARSAPQVRGRRCRRRSTSGLVEVTWPSTRCGSGVVKTSSVGRFGMCSMPSTVSKRAAIQRAARQQADGEVGARAAVVERVEAALGEPLRRRRSSVSARRVQAATRVVLVEPQHVHRAAARAWRAPRRRLEVGMDERRPRRASGTGAIVQLVVAAADDLAGLLDRGSWSRPARTGRGRRAGRGRPGPESAMRAARCSTEREHAVAVPLRHEARACPRARTRSARA